MVHYPELDLGVDQCQGLMVVSQTHGSESRCQGLVWTLAAKAWYGPWRSIAAYEHDMPAATATQRAFVLELVSTGSRTNAIKKSVCSETSALLR